MKLKYKSKKKRYIFYSLGAGLISSAFLVTLNLAYLDYVTTDNSGVLSQKEAKPAVKQVKKKKGKKYALLINADANSDLQKLVFINAMNLAGSTLLNSGFSRENIYVLDGLNPENSATKRNLIYTLNKLKRKITSDDIFFMYVTNHGEKRVFYLLPFYETESCFLLNDGRVYESELKQMLKGLKPNYGVFCFNTCFSGGFAEALGSGNFIGISSCKSDKLSISDLLTNTPVFSRHFFAALNGIDSETRRAVNADSNNNGKISIEEAFDYAAIENDRTLDSLTALYERHYNETPQLMWQNAEPSELYLGD